ncbi:MAG TPA: metallophosphoesterase [Solirubrobacterales bacterium]|nr:metallophosphoesterase [Solirubrobacterales bacterium]
MLRILHISDLHASVKGEDDRKRLVQAMLVDVVKLAGDGGVDLVVFSGDLADRGRASEYRLARELLLDPLVARLALEPSRIILVPGNHDVDRTQVRDLVERGLIDSLGDRDRVNELLESARDLGDATERLQSWRDFVAEFNPDSAAASHPGPLAAVHEFEFGATSVGVAALDSAWRASGEDDRGMLLLGDRQIESALERIAAADIRIAVTHHPLGWLASFDADQARIEFENHGVIVLSGHEHDPHPTALKSPGGEARYFSAGCLYQHREYPNSYSLIEVDPDAGTVSVRIRRWYEKRRDFDDYLEVAPDGRVEFSLPTSGRPADLGHPPYSTVMRLIAQAARELRVVPDEEVPATRSETIADVLVDPRFLTVPYGEAKAAATLDHGIAGHETDVVETLLESNLVLVSGGAQSGVTSALHWILAKAYERDAGKMPASMSAGESSLGRSRGNTTLAKAASRFGHRQADSRNPELTLAIDDIDEVSAKKRGNIIEFIAENPQHRYVLGCGEEHWPSIAKALEEAGVDHASAFLAPFGRAQLRQLLKSDASGAETSIDQIDGLMRAHKLPRTPFTMVALVAVVRTGYENIADLNESGLLEAYVNVLLGSGELVNAEQGMNFRKRVHLLGEIAHALYEIPDHSMPVPEVEQLLLSYFGKKGLRLSAGAVLKNLVSRHILFERDGVVSFRHPALLHLFVAHWMLEDDERKEEMLRDCRTNEGPIRHAAGLRRTDGVLLERVAEFARQTMRMLPPEISQERVDKILRTFGSTGSWEGDSLGDTLELLPGPQSVTEIDSQIDRLSDALSDDDAFDPPALAAAHELERTINLLSDVLRNSELVDDIGLKQGVFELAIRGWVLMIGVLIAEDVQEESFRDLIHELVKEKLLAEEGLEEDADDLLTRMILLVVVLLAAASMLNRLGSRHLTEMIEAALDNPKFSQSLTASCLATWLHAQLELRGWPERLDKLLDRLPRRTFLREATLAIGVTLYRTMDDEKQTKTLEQILTSHMTDDPGRDGLERGQQRDEAAKRLKQSRRSYQGLPDDRRLK